MPLTTLPFSVNPVQEPVIEIPVSGQSTFSVELSADIQAILEKTIEAHPEFENILVATADGFDIAAMIKDSDKDSIRRLAAISSSMLSLSIEILAEMCAGEQKILTLEGEKGNVFITQVSAETFALSLTVITRENESLGKFFWLIRQLKNEIEKACRNAPEQGSAKGGLNE